MMRTQKNSLALPNLCADRADEVMHQDTDFIATVLTMMSSIRRRSAASFTVSLYSW